MSYAQYVQTAMLRPEVRPHDISSVKRVEAPQSQHCCGCAIQVPGFKISESQWSLEKQGFFCPGTVVAPSRITTYANSIAT
jgi:hypothetical protein